MTRRLVSAPPAALALVSRRETAVAASKVRIRVGAAGICHTDFYLLEGSHPGATYPRVPGHEFSGVIEALGADVPDTLGIGTRIAAISTLACGHCGACRAGKPARCGNAEHLGTDSDGGWQEVVDVPWRAALPVGDQVSMVEAALFEPTANAHAALAAGHVGADDDIVVMGPGAIGILTALMAARLGPRSLAVLGLSIDGERLATARRVTGAETSSIDADGDATAQLLARATVVMQCAPSVAATSLALAHMQDGARLVIEGYAGDAATLPIGADEMVTRSLQLIGINGWTRADFEAVASLAARRAIDLGGIPVATFALAEHEAAIRAAHDNRAILRAMFVPNG